MAPSCCSTMTTGSPPTTGCSWSRTAGRLRRPRSTRFPTPTRRRQRSEPTSAPRQASTPVAARGNVTYTYLIARAPRRIADHPALRLAGLTNDQKAAMQDDAAVRGRSPVQKVIRLHPPAGAPAVRRASASVDGSANRRIPSRSTIENVYDAAQILSEPRSVNPSCPGSTGMEPAWWTIKGLVDGTGNFLFSGKVTFCVPSTLQPTDVVGRTSHWIRARLVGGDYGRESVSITTAPFRTRIRRRPNRRSTDRSTRSSRRRSCRSISTTRSAVHRCRISC